ncbi:MAG: alpha/beta fold hydrolase [Synoicihabitans sp.]
MRLLLCLFLILSSTAIAETAPLPPPKPKPVAVLLHGLGLGSWAMKRVEQRLTDEGYRVVNLSYQSRKIPLEELVSDWLPGQLTAHEVGLAKDAPALHFVTHSMGGIVLRGWLKSHPAPPANFQRVVMFVPPNQGSALVDRIGTWKAFKITTGVNGVRLSTAPDSYPRQLGPWPDGPELGVIAGDRPINPLLAYWTGGKGDGKVLVEETKLDGMTDHLVMPYSHTWIQYRQKPIAQVITFLQHGRFTR